jgi:EAL domain-containing protein (putative c-di-GMP-specific phosphodiesterase class I)
MSEESAIRIVLIDDHEMFLQSLLRLLQEDPQLVVVGTALTAGQGFEITQQLRPDVVIIDYHLPDMDAPEAIRRLREVHPEGKIITLTGEDGKGALYASLRAGSSAWVRKTRAIQELRDAVRNVAADRPVSSEEMDSLPALDQLVLHYQPIVELVNERVVGFEALTRWQHPERGLLYPAAFLPLAVDTGFMIEIDKWVWKQAALQLRYWQQSYSTAQRTWMSVNISTAYLSEPGLFESISGIVRFAGIDPTDLVLEVTESVLLDDTAQTMDFLTRVKGLGVGLALDDFGKHALPLERAGDASRRPASATAFSWFSNVRRLPFDHLKLDVSFTAELPQSGRSTRLIEEICNLASSMKKMRSIAEGVERQEQADALRGIGCEYGQGYLFSRPVPAADCEALLAAGYESASERLGRSEA